MYKNIIVANWAIKLIIPTAVYVFCIYIITYNGIKNVMTFCNS